jgi:hypothetical protein
VSDGRPPTGAGPHAAEAPGTRSSTSERRAAGSTPSDIPTGASPEPRRCAGGRPSTEPCPRCDVPRVRGDAFCEGCGHAFSADGHAAEPPANGRPWAAVIAPDRAYFDRVAPAAMSFPSRAAARKFMCDETEIRIGRHTASHGPRPEIDLGDPPEDPAISHLHAILLQAPDGRYSIIDPGSTNGTTINENPSPIPVGVPMPLAHGDRIHLGAWTTITLVDDSASTDTHR